jgi:TRAP-type C4-dicarboxylate transport system permease small subunit
MKATLHSRMVAVLNAADTLLLFIAVLCLCTIGLLTTIDVAMRYLFHSPFSFSFDLTSMYLFPASVLLVLSDVFRKNENIEIDLFSNRMPIKQWRFYSLVGGLAACAIFATIAAMYIGKTIHAYVAGESTFGAISWPMWPAMAIAAIGFSFLSLAILCRSIEHLAGTSQRPPKQEFAE